MGLYLAFYYFILVPPRVVSIFQPLNLRYPDPNVNDYIYAYHCISPVTYPQQYNWKLSLQVPESPTNFDAGVFMVSLALYPPDQLPTQPPEEVRDMFYRHLKGNVGNPSVELEPIGDKSIRIGSRPLMLRYRPDVYRFLHTLVYMVPRLVADILAVEWFEETQHMELNLIERHVTTRNSTLTTKQCFVVSINNPRVQIYSASVEATVLLEGWRYVLYYWFWSSLFAGTGLIFGLLVFSITMYLLGRLLSKVVRGEVQLPRWFVSDDEQQMRDMKDAVASLMHQKKEERKTRQRQLDQQRRESFDERDRAAPSRGDRGEISPREKTHEPHHAPSSPSGDHRYGSDLSPSGASSPTKKRRRRPPSWVDIPLIAEPSQPAEPSYLDTSQSIYSESSSTVVHHGSPSDTEEDEDDEELYESVRRMSGEFEAAHGLSSTTRRYDTSPEQLSGRETAATRMNRFERDGASKGATARPAAHRHRDSFSSEQSLPINIPKGSTPSIHTQRGDLEDTTLLPTPHTVIAPTPRTPHVATSDLAGGDLGGLLISGPNSGRVSPSDDAASDDSLPLPSGASHLHPSQKNQHQVPAPSSDSPLGVYTLPVPQIPSTSSSSAPASGISRSTHEEIPIEPAAEETEEYEDTEGGDADVVGISHLLQPRGAVQAPRPEDDSDNEGDLEH